MVPDTPQVEEVLFGENGCTKASLKGKTIVDMSSISPIETKRFARQVNELGGDYLDAPVSGGEIGAREGRCRLWLAVTKRYLNVLNRAACKTCKVAKAWRSFLKPCQIRAPR